MRLSVLCSSYSLVETWYSHGCKMTEYRKDIRLPAVCLGVDEMPKATGAILYMLFIEANNCCYCFIEMHMRILTCKNSVAKEE